MLLKIKFYLTINTLLKQHLQMSRKYIEFIVFLLVILSKFFFAMYNYQIESQETTRKSIRKFAVNQFLAQFDTFRFNNKNETKNSPLASRLFSLSYVKTVIIAQNFVAIEIFKETDWNEKEEEVRLLIQNHLNSNKIVIEEAAKSKKVPVTVYAETTNNPMAVRFVCDKKLVIQSVQFNRVEETTNAPLAQELFKFPFVRHVFINHNYVTITRTQEADWNEIIMELREFIRRYLMLKKTILNRESPLIKNTVIAQENYKALPVTAHKIIEFLEEHIQKEAASKGGAIKFRSYDPETGKVELVFQGSMKYAPSTKQTLKNGIEPQLKELLGNKISSVTPFHEQMIRK